MEILNQLASSINTYFRTLTHFGYKKQSDVNKLLVYNFIGEMLTEEMRFFITEEDYKIIEQALYCLYGSSCLIPYPQYINDDSLFGSIEYIKFAVPRITEDTNIRFTEDNRLRLKTSNYNK